jgi:LPXTG-site transpeptidase (sortase) family protein
MTRPRPALIVLVASAATLVAVPVGVAAAGSSHEIEQAGARPDFSISSPAAPGVAPDSPAQPDPDPSAAPTDSAEPAPAANPGTTGTRVDATIVPRPSRLPAPTRVVIPDLDLRIPVDTVGLDDRNQVIVPQDVSRAGWYRYAATPGADTGSAVIVAHRDGVDQGPGAFYNLGDLEVGDPILVQRERGEPLRYRVVAREQFGKSDIPLAELFSTQGRHRLTLITCGGPFDPGALEYTDNVVVTAVIDQ